MWPGKSRTLLLLRGGGNIILGCDQEAGGKWSVVLHSAGVGVYGNQIDRELCYGSMIGGCEDQVGQEERKKKIVCIATAEIT